MHRLKTLSLRSILLLTSLASFAGAARCEPQAFKISHASLSAMQSPGVAAAYGATPGAAMALPSEAGLKQPWLARHRFNLCLQGEAMKQAANMAMSTEAVIGGTFNACAAMAEPMTAERQARLARLLGMLVAMQRLRAGESSLAAIEAGP